MFVLSIILPFIGTSIGSSFVFFLKDKVNIRLEKILLGLSSGIMISASIWSLLIPSINMSKSLNNLVWLPASIGFLIGMFILTILENKINLNKFNIDDHKLLKMIFAVILHNIPEGMAVGVMLAGAISSNSNITLIQSLMFSIGIAIQNIPEGAIISMPLKDKLSKNKAFLIGILSGIVEPIASILTIFLTNVITILLPYLLSFAAGCMIYVVVIELIPEFKKSNYSILGLSIGFIIMMILDITL